MGASVFMDVQGRSLFRARHCLLFHSPRCINFSPFQILKRSTDPSVTPAALAKVCTSVPNCRPHIASDSISRLDLHKEELRDQVGTEIPCELLSQPRLISYQSSHTPPCSSPPCTASHFRLDNDASQLRHRDPAP